MTDARGLKAAFEEHLKAETGAAEWQRPLYRPMAYILDLGGKRIRPLLLMMAYQAVSGKAGTGALNTALAVEMFHNFTLIHDDIMDNAPVRRGKTTVHEKWDTNTAILAGDAMFTIAMEYLVRDFPQFAAPLVKEFTRISFGVCEGQMEDMLMAGSEKADIPGYIEMIRKKTAMLLGGCMSLGAISAGADEATVKAFYDYGEAAGIGFQLHDDYLDVYADVDKFGKQVGGDILEAKMTWLLLRAIEKSDHSQKGKLDVLLFEETDPAKKVRGVTELYNQLDIPGETLRMMDHYFTKADEAGKMLAKFEGFENIDFFLQQLRKRDH